MTRQIGYVGLDHHHRDPYLETIAQLDAQIVATADPTGVRPQDIGADALTDHPWYADVSVMLDNEDIDLLWVTLPNDATPSVIHKALDADVDVLTEKPSARTATELAPIIERLDSSDATIGVSYAWRGHPIANELRNRATTGFFGQIQSFALRFIAASLTSRPTDHYLYDRASSRGGIVQWLGVHFLDLLPWVLDDPIVRVNATTTTTASVDVEDGATIQLELESGAIGSFTTGYYLRDGRYDTRFDIFGTKSDSAWDPMGATFGFDGETSVELSSDDWVSTPHRRIVHEYTPADGYGGHWGLEFFETFLAACDGKGTAPADVTDALQVLRVLDAVYESATAEQWVTVETDPPRPSTDQ